MISQQKKIVNYLMLLSKYAPAIFSAICLSVIVFLLTSYRMQLVYRLFQLHITIKQALVAQAATALGNMFWVPIVGGLIGQKKALTHIAPAVMASVHMFERIFVASIGALCALGGAWYIWGRDVWQLIPFVPNLIHVLAAMMVIGLFVFQHNLRIGAQNILTWKFLGLSLLISLIWGLSALIFAGFLYPQYSFSALFSHSMIVSFLSSLPITWNGWGVREASAVLVFRHMGVSTVTSLSIAITCGVISMLVMLVMGGIWYKKRTPKTATEQENLRITAFDESHFVRALGAACAFLIFFQVHVKRETFTLNVNAADPLAMCGLFLYGLHLWHTRHDEEAWGPLLFIGLTAASLVLSSLWGITQFGGSWWGGLNKTVGLWVVWGYFGLGMTLARYDQDLSYLLEIMKKVVVCIVVYHFLCLAVNQTYYTGNLLCSDLRGFAMNRNAFAMQVLCVVIALASSTQSYRSLVVMNVALYFTFSRTAAVLTPLIYLGMWWINLMSISRLLRITILSIVWIVGINMIYPSIKFLIKMTQSSQDVLTTFFPTLYSGTYSDSERWYTIVQGFRMWLDHPWVGAGLGAFVQNEFLQHQRYLMIHNSYIWILAEMGVVGAAIWGAFSSWIVRAGWNLPTSKRWIVLGMCFVLFAAAAVHEVIYQRIFWWMFGLFLGAHPQCLALPQKITHMFVNLKLRFSGEPKAPVQS